MIADNRLKVIGADGSYRCIVEPPFADKLGTWRNVQINEVFRFRGVKILVLQGVGLTVYTLRTLK